MPITGPGRPTWASRVKASPIDWHSNNQARPVSKGDVLMGSIMFRAGSQPSKMIEGLMYDNAALLPARARETNLQFEGLLLHFGTQPRTAGPDFTHWLLWALDSTGRCNTLNTA